MSERISMYGKSPSRGKLPKPNTLPKKPKRLLTASLLTTALASLSADPLDLTLEKEGSRFFANMSFLEGKTRTQKRVDLNSKKPIRAAEYLLRSELSSSGTTRVLLEKLKNEKPKTIGELLLNAEGNARVRYINARQLKLENACGSIELEHANTRFAPNKKGGRDLYLSAPNHSISLKNISLANHHLHLTTKRAYIDGKNDLAHLTLKADDFLLGRSEDDYLTVRSADLTAKSYDLLGSLQGSKDEENGSIIFHGGRLTNRRQLSAKRLDFEGLESLNNEGLIDAACAITGAFHKNIFNNGTVQLQPYEGAAGVSGVSLRAQDIKGGSFLSAITLSLLAKGELDVKQALAQQTLALAGREITLTEKYKSTLGQYKLSGIVHITEDKTINRLFKEDSGYHDRLDIRGKADIHITVDSTEMQSVDFHLTQESGIITLDAIESPEHRSFGVVLRKLHVSKDAKLRALGKMEVALGGLHNAGKIAADKDLTVILKTGDFINTGTLTTTGLFNVFSTEDLGNIPINKLLNQGIIIAHRARLGEKPGEPDEKRWVNFFNEGFMRVNNGLDGHFFKFQNAGALEVKKDSKVYAEAFENVIGEELYTHISREQRVHYEMSPGIQHSNGKLFFTGLTSDAQEKGFLSRAPIEGKDSSIYVAYSHQRLNFNRADSVIVCKLEMPYTEPEETSRIVLSAESSENLYITPKKESHLDLDLEARFLYIEGQAFTLTQHNIKTNAMLTFAVEELTFAKDFALGDKICDFINLKKLHIKSGTKLTTSRNIDINATEEMIIDGMLVATSVI